MLASNYLTMFHRFIFCGWSVVSHCTRENKYAKSNIFMNHQKSISGCSDRVFKVLRIWPSPLLWFIDGVVTGPHRYTDPIQSRSTLEPASWVCGCCETVHIHEVGYGDLSWLDSNAELRNWMGFGARWLPSAKTRTNYSGADNCPDRIWQTSEKAIVLLFLIESITSTRCSKSYSKQSLVSSFQSGAAADQ